MIRFGVDDAIFGYLFLCYTQGVMRVQDCVDGRLVLIRGLSVRFDPLEKVVT